MDEAFRARVRERRPLVGAFIKSAAPEIAEVLGVAGLDFAIADGEHAPLGIGEISRIVTGARLGGLPCLARLPAFTPGAVGRMLDMGAAGVVVPHVVSEAMAAAAVAETRFGGGLRGYSPSTRANAYGTGDAESYAARADAGASLWCQIEDAAALERLDAIAAVEGIDALFIGRADLARSLGVRLDDRRIAQATSVIAAAGRRHGRAVATFVADMTEAPVLAALGISVFACGSDQSHLLAAARGIAAARDGLPSFPGALVKSTAAPAPNRGLNKEQEP